MTTKKWRQVSVPDETMKTVDGFVEKSPKYQSSSEFVRHAVVEKLLRENPRREETHSKKESKALPFMDYKNEVLGKASSQEKISRDTPSLEEVTKKAAVEES